MSASATQSGHKKTFLHLWFTAMFSSHFLPPSTVLSVAPATFTVAAFQSCLRDKRFICRRGIARRLMLLEKRLPEYRKAQQYNGNDKGTMS